MLIHFKFDARSLRVCPRNFIWSEDRCEAELRGKLLGCQISGRDVGPRFETYPLLHDTRA